MFENCEKESLATEGIPVIKLGVLARGSSVHLETPRGASPQQALANKLRVMIFYAVELALVCGDANPVFGGARATSVVSCRVVSASRLDGAVHC